MIKKKSKKTVKQNNLINKRKRIKNGKINQKLYVKVHKNRGMKLCILIYLPMKTINSDLKQ